jgi:hypothetical protein
VIKRTARLFALYAVGTFAVAGWSLSHVLGGTVTTENAAGVIVFPLAWIFGYWPAVLPLVVAYRIWHLQATIEEIAARKAIGLDPSEQVQDIEDTLTLLAVQENGIPEWFVRPIVRRCMQTAGSDSAAA